MKLVSVIALFMLSLFSGISSASVTATVGNVVYVSCGVPSVAGATVFTVDNTISVSGAINTITLPTEVVAAAPCAAAINALNGAVCDASTHHWIVGTAVNVAGPGVRKPVIQYTATCQ